MKDIYPGGPDDDGVGFSNLVVFNDRLYFSAEDGERGKELWASDGTEEGTLLFKDFLPGTGFSGSGDPDNFFVTDSVLYFSARDSSGRRIWKTDGTPEGTQIFLDLEIGTEFVDANGTLFFSAIDTEVGRELWRTDGTVDGTYLMADIFEGQSNSNPRIFGFINDVLYFEAEDAENGRELRALSPFQIQAEVSSSREQICSAQDSIIIIANINEAGEEPMLQWLVNGQAIDNQTGEQFTAKGLGDGDSISLRVIADPGVWTLTDTVDFEAIIIDIDELAVDITISGNQLIATEAQAYRWYLNGELLSDTTQTITAQESGIYQVEVFNELGCSYLSSEFNIEVVTSIDPRLKSGITLYPHPVSSTLHINSQLNEVVSVILFSYTGQQLFETQLYPQQQGLQIPLDKYSSGMYILQLRTVKGGYYHKLMKR